MTISIAIHQAFDRRIENDDGTVAIHLNDVDWSRCLRVMAEVAPSPAATGKHGQSKDHKSDAGPQPPTRAVRWNPNWGGSA